MTVRRLYACLVLQTKQASFKKKTKKHFMFLIDLICFIFPTRQTENTLEQTSHTIFYHLS